MARPRRVYNPMTGRPDHGRSETGVFPLYERGEKAYIPDEPVERILGFSDHRIARLDGNVERISIRGTRIA